MAADSRSAGQPGTHPLCDLDDRLAQVSCPVELADLDWLPLGESGLDSSNQSRSLFCRGTSYVSLPACTVPCFGTLRSGDVSADHIGSVVRGLHCVAIRVCCPYDEVDSGLAARGTDGK